MSDKKKKADKDVITLAKSIFDEIIGETESENWCKTLEPKKSKRQTKQPRLESENQIKGRVKMCRYGSWID